MDKGLEQLIEEKQAQYAAQGVDLTREQAIEEVVADGCEMMLKDSQAIQKLVEQDRSLAQKVLDWLRNFIDKLRKAFDGVSYEHREAALLMQKGTLKYLEGLQELWDQALMGTVEGSANEIVDQFVKEYKQENKGAKFQARGGTLLDAGEYKRLGSNNSARKFNGYQYERRPNGGYMVFMGDILVYTHPTGEPEYVLEISTGDAMLASDVQQKAVQLVMDGVKHEVQRKVLKSLYGEANPHFRTRKKRSNAGWKDGRRSGSTQREMGRGNREEVSFDVEEDDNLEFQLRDGDTISSREALANALQSTAQNDRERELLAQYKGIIKELDEDEAGASSQLYDENTINYKTLLSADAPSRVYAYFFSISFSIL